MRIREFIPPTTIAERPVEQSDLNIYVDTSFANIGTTLVTEALAESLNLNDKYKPVFVHNRTVGEFYDVVEFPTKRPTASRPPIMPRRALAASISANSQRWLRCVAR